MYDTNYTSDAKFEWQKIQSDSKMQKPSDVIEDAPQLYNFWSYKIHMAEVKGEEFFHQ